LRVLWVAGGPHATAAPEETLQLGFDCVVQGEGEATFLDLMRTIVHGGDWTAVPGISFRDPSGKTRSTGPRAAIDLDAFPPFPLVRRRVVGPIEITRGCPFACGYCQTSHLMGRQLRHRSVEVIARFAGVIRQRGLRDVRVVAPNAFSYGSHDGRTLNLPALELLLSTLRQTLGREGRLYFGTFPSEVRPEHVQDATLDLVKRYADNDNLILGAQSGSDRLLAHCGRAHTVADVFSAVSRTVSAGLKPHVDFIFGLPGETDEDLKQTIEVIRELVAMGSLIHAHTFMPLPQTRFANEPCGRISGRLRPFLKELIRRDALYITNPRDC
jgi:B12-binding domain/radical SAM domain protein